MIEHLGDVELAEILLTLQFVHDTLSFLARQNSEPVGFLHVSARFMTIGCRLG